MNIPATRVSTIRITQTRFELKSIFGLSQLKTTADKKIKKILETNIEQKMSF